MGQIVSYFQSKAQPPKNESEDALIAAVINDINKFDTRTLAKMNKNMDAFDGSHYHLFNQQAFAHIGNESISSSGSEDDND